jgi:hypothetical protein
LDGLLTADSDDPSAAAKSGDSAAIHDPVSVTNAGAATLVPTMRSMNERRDGSDGDTLPPLCFRSE